MSTNVAPEAVRELVEKTAQALLARLRADNEIANVVFEGDVDGDPERYVNVHHDTGFWTAHDYTNSAIDVEVTFTIHSVGTSRWQAVWVSGRVVAQLLTFTPTIPGRRSFRAEPAGTQPVALDRDVTPPKHFAVDRFVLRSIPA